MLQIHKTVRYVNKHAVTIKLLTLGSFRFYFALAYLFLCFHANVKRPRIVPQHYIVFNFLRLNTVVIQTYVHLTLLISPVILQISDDFFRRSVVEKFSS